MRDGRKRHSCSFVKFFSGSLSSGGKLLISGVSCNAVLCGLTRLTLLLCAVCRGVKSSEGRSWKGLST